MGLNEVKYSFRILKKTIIIKKIYKYFNLQILFLEFKLLCISFKKRLEYFTIGYISSEFINQIDK
jgi:hypothetical protein